MAYSYAPSSHIWVELRWTDIPIYRFSSIVDACKDTGFCLEINPLEQPRLKNVILLFSNYWSARNNGCRILRLYSLHSS